MYICEIVFHPNYMYFRLMLLIRYLYLLILTNTTNCELKEFICVNK